MTGRPLTNSRRTIAVMMFFISPPSSLRELQGLSAHSSEQAAGRVLRGTIDGTTASITTTTTTTAEASYHGICPGIAARHTDKLVNDGCG